MRISNIQKFSLHDGPGFRTTIFLSGCPLRCKWCHNPETYITRPTLIYEEAKCINCSLCRVCKVGAHKFDEGHKIAREACVFCGECTEKCPTGALSLSSRELSKEEFVSLVEGQKKAFRNSGGITFSGGEPLMQGDVILDYIKGVPAHYAIETSGYADGALFLGVIDKMDFIMFDIKLANDEEHRKYTGVSNKIILDNLEILRKSGKDFILRTPLIPGVTDTEENLSLIREIVKDSPWETLEYNPLTPSKYERIGLKYSL